MIKKTLALMMLICCGLFSELHACDNSAMSIANQVDNGDGTVTYTLNLTTELGGFDNTYYGFTLTFISSDVTPVVTGFPATITNGDLSSGSISGTLFGLTGGDINSIAGDSDWNPYLGLTSTVSYEDGSLFGAASNDFNMQLEITISGCAESIAFNSSVNSGSNACIVTASAGQNCAACSITNIIAAAQSLCDPSTNTYTQVISVSYANAPTSGTLDVNGQSFAITSSPQSVNLVGLVADGNPVNVSAEFSDDGACALSSNGLFFAPAACGTPCTPDNGTWD